MKHVYLRLFIGMIVSLLGFVTLSAQNSTEDSMVFGNYVVFQSNRDGNWEIYRTTIDGNEVINLTSHEANDREPAWSPDARSITFASDRDGNYEIYTMALDGSNVQKVTINDFREDRYPQYLPDASEIVFYSDRNKSHDSWRVNLTTGVVAKYFGEAEWSFTRTRDTSRNLLAIPMDGQSDVFIRDESGLTQLTDDIAEDRDPRWSPDDTQVIFANNASGNFDLVILNLETGERRLLITNSADDLYPAWQPIPANYDCQMDSTNYKEFVCENTSDS